MSRPVPASKKTQSPLPHPRYRTKFRRESFPSDLHVAALPATSRPRARRPILAPQTQSAAPPATHPPVYAPPRSYLSPPLVPPNVPPRFPAVVGPTFCSRSSRDVSQSLRRNQRTCLPIM